MKNADIELIKKEISNFWDYYNGGNTLPIETKKYVDQTLMLLDNGFIRICEKKEGVWIVHQWIKKAILLSFKILLSKFGPRKRYFFLRIGMGAGSVPLL